VTIDLPFSPNGVAGFTDLDGDGSTDALLFDDFGGEEFAVLYGADTFGGVAIQTYRPSTDEFYFTYNMADLDGNGQGSIVRLEGDTFGGSSIEVRIFEIESDRSLTEVQSFAAEELRNDAYDNRLSLIDITGNDTLEIAAKSRFGTKTYVFERDAGSGTYIETPDSLGKDDAVPVGDLDGDGGHDFYTFEDSTDTRYVSYGPSDLSEGLTFDTEIPYGDDVFGAADFLPEGGLGDVTGDGRSDVGLGLSDNPDETVGRRFFSVNSDRTGRPPADITYPEGHFFDRILEAQEVGDFNGDGTDDFALVRFDVQQIEVFYGGSPISSSPDLTIESPIDEEYISIVSGDYNGDGASDLAAEYSAGNRIEIFLGGSGADGQVDHVIDPEDFAFEQLYYLHTIGDINGDGADDLLVKDGDSSGEQDTLGVFLGGSPLPSTPDATFQYSADFGAGQTAAAPGDVSGDGIDDFVVGLPFFSDDQNAEGRADVYFGGSNPSFSSPDLTLRPEDLSSNIDEFANGLTGGDFDGDGDGDIAVRPLSAPDGVQISIFEGGSGIDAAADQRLAVPPETGLSRDFGEDGAVDLLYGLLEAVSLSGQPDALVQGSAFTGTNAVLYRPLTGDSEPAAVFRAPNQDAGMGGFSALFGGIAAADFTGSGRTDVVFPQTDDNNDADLSSRVYRYEFPVIPVASATVDVEENGEKPFEGTGLAINFSNISGEDDVVATKYLNPPVNAGTINEEGTAVRYTVETGDGLTFGAGTAAQFSTTSPPLDGLENPGDVVVYHREVPGTGTFEALETTYDAEADEIVAPIESFGELVLTTTAGPVTVWPGDTNNDGVVDQADVLPLGIYWGSSGPARSETGCSWEGQSADSWSPAAATYADADGDGTVDQADVLCLGLNWGRSHSTSSESLVATSRSAQEPAGRLALRLGERSGSTVWVNIHAEGISSLRGVAAELSFAPEKVSVATVESGRRMGDAALLQSNTNETEGTLGLGISRKSGSSSAGDADEAVARVKLRTDVRRPELSARDVRASTVEGTTVPLATGDGLQNLPDEVTLSAPAPNPVRQQATLRYALPEAQSIRLSVYDVMGREVAVLIDQRQNPGRKQVRLDASQLSSGTYFYRLRAGETTKTKRLTVVR
jgi:hypothetical protein